MKYNDVVFRNPIKVVTCESVTEGHPDKLCDIISDSILDAYLSKDKNARVACETIAKDNTIILVGEVSSSAYVDRRKVVSKVLKKIGYDDEELWGTDYKTFKLIDLLGSQSKDISKAVNKEKIQAGDQGIMYGYACDETDCFMPLAYVLATRLVKKLTEERKSGHSNFLGPDGKAQVSVVYYDDGTYEVANVVISSQHFTISLDKDKELEILRKSILDYVVKPVLGALMPREGAVFINPAGRFAIGGPTGDSGLTGRKLMVDTYGGVAHHGGGAFSGKDPSKVDRSGAYFARWLAKLVVCRGIASECEVMLSYMIGRSETTSVLVNAKYNEGYKLRDVLDIVEEFDSSPQGIIDRFKLFDIHNYSSVAAYGHFGENAMNMPWENVEL